MSALRKIAAVSALLMATTPVLAASDYLLQLDTVKGEAAPQTIEVQSFSWGVSNSGAVSSKGGGTGKVSMQDISMTSVQSPRDVSTGMASGKRAAPAAAADAQPAAATAAPKVGDDASFTVVTAASSADKAGEGASGTPFPHAATPLSTGGLFRGSAQGRRPTLRHHIRGSCIVTTPGGSRRPVRMIDDRWRRG